MDKHLNLLRKITWSFHKSTGMEWDDLFQESYIAYRYALDHYDPDKGVSISSFIWTHISNQLRTYYNKEKKYNEPLIGLDKVYSKQVNPDLFFESLTADATKVAELVLTTPKKFVELPPKKAKKRVKNVMTNRGWSMERIETSLNELIIACSNS